MVSIRLGKIPDRVPVRLALTLPPDLHQALLDYAALYREAYGDAETVPELVPWMLRAFLETDRAFLKTRQGGQVRS